MCGHSDATDMLCSGATAASAGASAGRRRGIETRRSAGPCRGGALLSGKACLLHRCHKAGGPTPQVLFLFDP